jgi:hypothetical protein
LIIRILRIFSTRLTGTHTGTDGLGSHLKKAEIISYYRAQINLMMMVVGKAETLARPMEAFANE